MLFGRAAASLKESIGEAERGNQLDGHPHSSPGLTPIVFLFVVRVCDNDRAWGTNRANK